MSNKSDILSNYFTRIFTTDKDYKPSVKPGYEDMIFFGRRKELKRKRKAERQNKKKGRVEKSR
jgi:hypothetical protein